MRYTISGGDDPRVSETDGEYVKKRKHDGPQQKGRSQEEGQQQEGPGRESQGGQQEAEQRRDLGQYLKHHLGSPPRYVIGVAIRVRIQLGRRRKN